MPACRLLRRSPLLWVLTILVAADLGARPVRAQLAPPRFQPLPPPSGLLARLRPPGDGLSYGHHHAAISFSADGKLLAATGGAELDGLWNAATGKRDEHLQDFQYGSLLLFSPQGKQVVVAADDVMIIEFQTGKRRVHLGLPVDGINCLALSPDGKVLAGGGDGRLVVLWDTATGNRLHSLTGHDAYVAAVAFSPDGKTLASGSHDASVRLWDVATGKEVRRLTGHGDQVSALAFGRDGKTLASGSWDRTIRLWDVAAAKTVRVLEGHTYGVHAVAFAPDGKMLASGGMDGTLRLWDVAGGGQPRQVVVNPRGVRGVAFSPDGKTVATVAGTNDLRLWNPATLAAVRAFDTRPRAGQDRVSSSSMKTVYAVAISPDGKTAVTGGSNRTIDLWDLATGEHLRPLGRQPDVVWSLAFAPDGKTLASVGRRDGVVHLWEVATGKDLRPFRKRHQGGISRVLFAPDGKTLVAGGGSFDPAIHLWEAGSGKDLCSLRGHTDFVCGVAFTPDGKTLASVSYDTTLRLWEVSAGKERQMLPRPQTLGNPLRDGVAISADGKVLAVCTGNSIALLDPRSGRELRHVGVGTGAALSLAFSPDGKLLAAGGSDNQVRLWEVATGLERALFVGHQGGIPCVAFTGDGRVLASASHDGTALLWDVTGLKAQPPLPRPAAPAGETEALWQWLSGTDGPSAHQAVWKLAAVPGQTVPFLRERLRPAVAIKGVDLPQRIADLDSAKYAVRANANRTLEQMGEQARSALESALAGNLPLEARRRVERLLQRLENASQSPEQMQSLRAIEVLEHIGNREARQLLTILAGGASEARRTREARAALQRLAQGPAVP